ncbi:MAG: 3-dehydroquinate synthase [Terrimonas sp.]|nr:3-dehydroquinate synthase [Terrimonas sp.]
MKKKSFRIGSSVVDYYFDGGMAHLKEIADQSSSVIITDENVFNAHTKRFRNWNCIVIKPGEAFKVQATVDAIIDQLIALEADRKTTLIGVGGGVITDLTGYVAAVYMRGIRFGFVPTSILAMVDASIGGKNGIDIGPYKNLAGTIRQPAFILHDLVFLNSLPRGEWENGFAEIIKHACIRDASMFRELEAQTLKKFQSRKKSVSELIRRNAMIKTKVVQQDEFESGDRKLLNFGHTLGHALETQYELSHGQAIAIGMTYACHISSPFTGFTQTDRVTALLEKYGLPTYAAFERKKVFEVLQMDKKRNRKELHYVLLEKIGKAVIRPIPFKELQTIIEQL